MKIERDSLKHGSILPVAFTILEGIPEEALHHEAWTHRHPRALYMLSAQKVLSAFETALDNVERETSRFRSDTKFGDSASLLQAQRDLLYSLREHIDDCYSILLSLTEPPADRSQATRPEKYIKARQVPRFRRFESTITDYLVEHLAPLVNGLKHRGGYLHHLALWDTGDPSMARLGYYLEEVWQGAATGPSWHVHRDGNSGFSFSRDLRLHLYYLYELSERLTEVITATCSAWHGIQIAPTPAEDRKGRWVNVVRKLIAQPYQPFVNELSWPTPVVELHEDESRHRLIVKYPVRRHNSWPIRELRVQVGVSGGGPGSSFKVPYAGKPKRAKRRKT